MNRVVLITGGTSGIGLTIAKKALQSDDRVVLLSVDDEKKIETALQALRPFVDITIYHTDVSNENECKNTVDKVYAKYGRIDVLVNCAGVLGEICPVLEANLKDVYRTIQIDLMGSLYMGMYVAKHMKEQLSGVIINMSSVCGTIAANESIGYHAAKGGVDMATKVWAKVLAPYGIRCVGVAPGAVRTPILDPEWEKEGRKLHMRERLIEPEEIAEVVYFLSTEKASAINGTTIMVDDGYTSFKGIW